MPEIDALSSVLGGAPASTESSASELAETFDTFLSLLTTQLQHQDPLDPMDSGEFTQQLVMFTNAEQAVATNQKLDTLNYLTLGNQASSAVNYIGKTVVAAGSSTVLSDGSATWQYNLAGNATLTTLTVKDQSGQVVLTTSGEIGEGDHTFVWDGTDSQGVPLPDGTYDLAITATDINGQPVATTSSVEGKVTGIETQDGAIVLAVGDTTLPLSSVTAVKETPAPVAPEPEEDEEST